MSLARRKMPGNRVGEARNVGFNDNFGSIPRVFQTKLVREPYSFRICFNQFHQLFSRLVRVGI